MSTLNVSMPYKMRAFIEAHISTGEYQSASDYLRDLITVSPIEASTASASTLICPSIRARTTEFIAIICHLLLSHIVAQ